MFLTKPFNKEVLARYGSKKEILLDGAKDMKNNALGFAWGLGSKNNCKNLLE